MIDYFMTCWPLPQMPEIKTDKANEIIDQTLDVIGRFDEYIGDSIPDWMRQPIQKQLNKVRAEL